MEYLLLLKENKSKLIDFFKLSFIPDESLIHTILMNSPYKENLINDNLRHYVWKRDVGSPNVLEEKDFESILASGKLFARKFDIEQDRMIIEKLQEAIK